MNQTLETSPKRSLAVFYPGCIEMEVMLAIELLKGAHPTEICTPDGQDHVSATGLVYRCGLAYEAVDIQRYAAVLVPGGDPYAILENQAVDRLLQQAQAQGLLVAAICAGPLVLAKAGLLKGKRFTHGYGDFNRDILDPYWQGADFQDLPLVQDGTLLTAWPEAHIDFAVAVARHLGALADTEAEQKRQFYRGPSRFQS